MTGRIPRLAAWSLGTIGVASALVTAVLLPVARSEPIRHFELGAVAAAASFAVVGAIVAVHRPRNPLGWIHLVIAVSQGGNALAGEYARIAIAHRWLPGADVVAWSSMWTWAPGAVLLVTLAVLLFPDGRLPSRRWRPAVWLAVVSLLVIVVPTSVAAWAYRSELPGVVFGEAELGGAVPLAQQLQLAGLIGTAAAGAASLASLIARFRGVAPSTRLQLRWVTTAAVITVPTFVASALVPLPRPVLLVGSVLIAPLIPAAVGVAVLRYRLYEIDRIVSRTVAYTLVILVLAGLYAITVVALGTVARGVTGHAGGDLVVAASTLLVAAAFGPVRNRMRSAVDRRFNRGRYDAARTVEAFAHHLRHEVDLDAVADELCTAVRETIEPRQVRLWLAGPQQQPTP